MSSPTHAENPASPAERASTPHSAHAKPNETSKKALTGLLGIGKTAIKATPASCSPLPNHPRQKTVVSRSKFSVFLSCDRAHQPLTRPLRSASRRAREQRFARPRHQTPSYQYARANGTRLLGPLPHAMQAPPSSAPSGRRRIVAFVSSEIRSSHSRLPHQGA